jgi:hypothetical protein
VTESVRDYQVFGLRVRRTLELSRAMSRDAPTCACRHERLAVCAFDLSDEVGSGSGA